MPVIRPPLLAASGAAVSAACLAVMAVTAVSLGHFGPAPESADPGDAVTAPAQPVATTPLVATSTR
jgi:hypothetical protein